MIKSLRKVIKVLKFNMLQEKQREKKGNKRGNSNKNWCMSERAQEVKSCMLSCSGWDSGYCSAQDKKMWFDARFISFNTVTECPVAFQDDMKSCGLTQHKMLSREYSWDKPWGKKELWNMTHHTGALQQSVKCFETFYSRILQGWKSNRLDINTERRIKTTEWE